MSLLSDFKSCLGSNLSFQTQFCDKYFGGMIVYGAVYLNNVESICI